MKWTQHHYYDQVDGFVIQETAQTSYGYLCECREADVLRFDSIATRRLCLKQVLECPAAA
jgi:hypothetical protein